jgi:hypothetical protein
LGSPFRLNETLDETYLPERGAMGDPDEQSANTREGKDEHEGKGNACCQQTAKTHQDTSENGAEEDAEVVEEIEEADDMGARTRRGCFKRIIVAGQVEATPRQPQRGIVLRAGREKRQR